MRGHSKIVFSLALVALFLATLIVQPRLMAQNLQQQISLLNQFEGGGFTTDPKKLGSRESVGFTQNISLERADFESGLVPLDDEAVVAAPTLVISPNPILPGGVDHAAAGTGTRNAGNGTIRLRGVPVGATLLRAWLYWGTVFANPVPTTSTAIFNGTTVRGNRINAPTAEPCWLF